MVLQTSVFRLQPKAYGAKPEEQILGERTQIHEEIGFVDVEVPEDKGRHLPSLSGLLSLGCRKKLSWWWQ